MAKTKRRYKCALCQKFFKKTQMSAEHYPAKSLGNNDIIALDFLKMMNTIQSPVIHEVIKARVNKGEKYSDITREIFDKYLAKDLYPNGRTVLSLCRNCNTFLGKYDESYQKFFNLSGDPGHVKGFQQKTKLQIIKAIMESFCHYQRYDKKNLIL